MPVFHTGVRLLGRIVSLGFRDIDVNLINNLSIKHKLTGGFLIAGKDEYLEPFRSGQGRIDDLLENGESLTSNNPPQVKRWQEVRELKKQWLEQAALPEIDARRLVTQGSDAIANFREISSRTVGKEIFDSIRQLLAGLESKVANRS